MKHWDLTPGEQVTLSTASGTRLRGYLAFRDTVHACFMILREDELYLREFLLRFDGGIEETLGDEIVGVMAGGSEYNSAEAVRLARERRRVWRIEGPDRNMRMMSAGGHP